MLLNHRDAHARLCSGTFIIKKVEMQTKRKVQKSHLELEAEVCGGRKDGEAADKRKGNKEGRGGGRRQPGTGVNIGGRRAASSICPLAINISSEDRLSGEFMLSNNYLAEDATYLTRRICQLPDSHSSG